MQDCDNRVKKAMAPLEKSFNTGVLTQDQGQVQLHKNPKYKDLYKHVLEATKESGEANAAAAEASRKNGSLKTEIKLAETNQKYWENVSKSTLDYVKKNFPPEERDKALAFILWNLYD